MTTPTLEPPTTRPDALTDEDTACRLIESVDDVIPCLYFASEPGDNTCTNAATHTMHSSCGHDVPLCADHAAQVVIWLHGASRRACLCYDPRPPHHAPYMTVTVTVVPL
jgi:hypothetical protein